MAFCHHGCMRKKAIKFIYEPNCTLWAVWTELVVTDNHSPEYTFQCRMHRQCWGPASARGRCSHTGSKTSSSPTFSTRWTSVKKRRRGKKINVFTAAFRWNNRFVTRCSCHLCRLLSNRSFYCRFCCRVICQFRLSISGVRIIMTAMFLLLSFCLAGDWFCQFHRVHVLGNMPGAFYLLPFSADALLEQETLQQRVYWNSWWVGLCACPSKPLLEKHLDYFSVIVRRNFHLVRQTLIGYITESVKSFPFFSSSVFQSVDLPLIRVRFLYVGDIVWAGNDVLASTNKSDTSKEPKRQ